MLPLRRNTVDEGMAAKAENARLRAQLAAITTARDEAATAYADMVWVLRDALGGLVGLVQLVRSRTDCPAEIKRALADHYRLDDACEAMEATK